MHSRQQTFLSCWFHLLLPVHTCSIGAALYVPYWMYLNWWNLLLSDDMICCCFWTASVQYILPPWFNCCCSPPAEDLLQCIGESIDAFLLYCSCFMLSCNSMHCYCYCSKADISDILYIRQLASWLNCAMLHCHKKANLTRNVTCS